jgi:hypothetical protein
MRRLFTARVRRRKGPVVRSSVCQAKRNGQTVQKVQDVCKAPEFALNRALETLGRAKVSGV